MSERFTQQGPNNPIPDVDGLIWVETGEKLDQAALLAAYFASHISPSVHKNYPLAAHNTAPGSKKNDEVIDQSSIELDKKRRRRVGALTTVAVIAVLGTSGTLIYNAMNPGAIQQTVGAALGNHLFTPSAPDNGITMNPMLTNSSQSLNLDKCILPQAELAVMSVSGTLPVKAILVDKDHPTPYTAKPYMNYAHETTLLANQQSKFHKFITLSQYPEMVFSNLPLGITICDTGAGIIPNAKSDGYVIDRSKLQVIFKDPRSKDMLNTEINIQPQTDSLSTAKLVMNKGEWGTYPVHGLFLANGADAAGNVIDPALNKSVASAVASMQDPEVIRTLTAIFEMQVVKQVATSSVTKQNGITYADGLTNSRDAFDKGLIERLGVTKAKISFKDNSDYNLQMDTPTNPNTKNSIAISNSIKTLNLSAIANLKSANIVYGYPSLETSTSTSPTVTPPLTPSPVPTSTDLP